MNEYMNTDFIETQGWFSINPQQVSKIEYYQNAVYFFFNDSDTASMRLKFSEEESARQSIEGFKMAVARKSIENELIKDGE